MAVWGALGTQLVPRVRLVEAQLACCWEEGAVVRRRAKSAQEHHPQEHSTLHAPGSYNKATSFLFQGKKTSPLISCRSKETLHAYSLLSAEGQQG